MANANNAPVVNFPPTGAFKLQPSPAELEFELNFGAANPRPQIQLGSQIVRRSVKAAKGVWDFAVQGGAIGNINLYDSTFAPGASAPPGQAQVNLAQQKNVFKQLIIPYNAIIVRALIDVITAPTGASCTIAFSTGVSSADLKSATAVGSLTGLVDTAPVNTAASSIKVLQPVVGSQGVTPFIAIATAPATAGKINVHFEYYLGD